MHWVCHINPHYGSADQTPPLRPEFEPEKFECCGKIHQITRQNIRWVPALRIEPVASLRSGEVYSYSVMRLTDDAMFNVNSLPGDSPRWYIQRYGKKWGRTIFARAEDAFTAIENGTVD